MDPTGGSALLPPGGVGSTQTPDAAGSPGRGHGSSDRGDGDGGRDSSLGAAKDALPRSSSGGSLDGGSSASHSSSSSSEAVAAAAAAAAASATFGAPPRASAESVAAAAAAAMLAAAAAEGCPAPPAAYEAPLRRSRSGPPVPFHVPPLPIPATPLPLELRPPRDYIPPSPPPGPSGTVIYPTGLPPGTGPVLVIPSPTGVGSPLLLGDEGPTDDDPPSPGVTLPPPAPARAAFGGITDHAELLLPGHLRGAPRGSMEPSPEALARWAGGAGEEQRGGTALPTGGARLACAETTLSPPSSSPPLQPPPLPPPPLPPVGTARDATELTRGGILGDGPPSAGATGPPQGVIEWVSGGEGAAGYHSNPFPPHLGALRAPPPPPPLPPSHFPSPSPPSQWASSLPPSQTYTQHPPPPPSSSHRPRVRFVDAAGVAPAPPSPPSPRSGHSGASGGSGGSGDSGADVPVFFHTEIHTRLVRLAARVTARDVALAGLEAGMTRMRLDARRGEEERSRLGDTVRHLRAVIDTQGGAMNRLRRELADASREVALARAERDRYAWLALHVHDGAVPGPDGRALAVGLVDEDEEDDDDDVYGDDGDDGGVSGERTMPDDGHGVDGSGGNGGDDDVAASRVASPPPIMPPHHLVSVATAAAARAVAAATAATTRIRFPPPVATGPGETGVTKEPEALSPHALVELAADAAARAVAAKAAIPEARDGCRHRPHNADAAAAAAIAAGAAAAVVMPGVGVPAAMRGDNDHVSEGAVDWGGDVVNVATRVNVPGVVVPPVGRADETTAAMAAGATSIEDGDLSDRPESP